MIYKRMMEWMWDVGVVCRGFDRTDELRETESDGKESERWRGDNMLAGKSG